MKLSAELWALSGGANAEWRRVTELRVRQAIEALRVIAEAARRRRPACWGELDIASSFDSILRGSGPARRRLLLFPALDNWLFLGRQLAQGARPAEEWESLLPFAQSFAAALALETRASRTLRVRVDPRGRFHATGSRDYLEFGPERAGALVEVRVRAGTLSAPGARPRRLAEVGPGTWVDFLDPLTLQPVYVHPPDAPSPAEEARYSRSLGRALDNIRAADPPLFEEIADVLRVFIPLKNPQNHGSVSSSYQTLRGALGLSHSEDVLLQEETIIHEFCHQKANLLAEADPLILPGQAGQVFYSPLRPDPRRLRGLLLGAHAFVNVNRYLLRTLAGGSLGRKEADSVARNVLRRVWHVEDMLRSVSGYARLTPFGESFVLRLWREAMVHHHDALTLPPGLVAEARVEYREHRARHALGDTGISRPLAPKQAAA